MAVRKIINIDEDKCDGCGLCVDACHEGAIQLINDKAKLVSEIYCDGLGDCLSECPQGAITIEEREAENFDVKAVEEHLARQKKPVMPVGGGCPGSATRTFEKPSNGGPAGGGCPGNALKTFQQSKAQTHQAASEQATSMLGHWPVQLKLVPPGAPFLKGADILICADCVPFAVPDFHSRYLAGKSVLVGCPKLDDLAFYEEKLKAIYAEARPASITVLKMEVPCCTGIAQAAIQARNVTAPDVEVKVYTIGLQGAENYVETVEAGCPA